jgi:MSHA biogenesis protein MshL
VNRRFQMTFLSTAIAALAGCAAIDPPVNRSTQQAIANELRQAAIPAPAAAIAVPGAGVVSANEQVGDLLLPSIDRIAPTQALATQQPRFDLVVSDAPIGQVLSGLVAGTEYSMLLRQISPPPMPPVAAQGLGAQAAQVGLPQDEKKITLELKNVTLFEALDSIRDLYGYEYTVNGKRILVQPEEIQTRIYNVNYVLGQRRGVSDIQVVGGASSGGSGSGGSSSYTSIQASGLSTSVRSDFWSEVEDSLRSLMGCSIPSVGQNAQGSPTNAASSGSTGSASRADVSHPGEAGSLYPGGVNFSPRARGSDGCAPGRSLTVNQMSGTILLRGMPRELRMAEKLLKSMQLSISRQVIIEAKIIDVELNADSQQGINWSAFRNGLHRFSVGANTSVIGVNQNASSVPGGTVAASVNLNDLIGTGLVGTAGSNAFTAGLGVAIQARNFSALINFLESQGRVFVLSSPRIATMNNQKAVLKVGSEEPFVTNITGGSTTVSNAGNVQSNPSFTYQPFFSGVALDVTPQIDEDDNITLHIHSMVNNISERSKIALPDSQTRVPFAVNTINETDSVVKAKDGQIIVIGGLMTEGTSDNRAGVPGASDVPGFGALFRKGAQTSIKRELVILLKPTVVKDNDAWSNDISGVGDRIGGMDQRR